MSNNMKEFEARSQEIHQLVSDDNLNRAIRRLLDFIRDFADESELQAEVILVSANHKKYIREERQNLIDFNSATQIRSRIINQILEIHKEACTFYKSKRKENVPRPKQTDNVQKTTTDSSRLETLTKIISNKAVHTSDMSFSNLILSTNALLKTYKKSGFRLDSINIELRDNEILGVVGENGNGKTTLFRLLTGSLSTIKEILYSQN